MTRISLIIFLMIFLLASCREKKTLFKKISSSRSGIHFRNDITENDSMNIIDLENIYNGGGVGIADFNNDGLEDIYFTGNMVPCKLYLNKGGLKFEDITATAGVDGEGKWTRGVSILDINNDGWQDLYVASTILTDSNKRENILYINQGLDREGKPQFKNLAEEYGLNDRSHTTQSAFFDYDNDGDLDVYLAVNVFAKRDNPNTYRRIFKNGEHPNTDRLYRNDWDSLKGHPVFTNVSGEAGILQEGFAHSVTICDINLDGWKDVFVANDYLSENLLYINNRNGSFTNRSKEYFKHTSFNSMGADVVDINNDGLSDVIELDMNPEDNYRKKTMLGSGKYQTYLNNNEYNYQYQYIRNTLHLNMGIREDDSTRQTVFSEIGFYAGIAETDWSWTPLVADFDNDGFRDLIVTNGFPKDVTDQDFIVYRNSTFALNAKDKLLAQIPEVKISNYAFRNNGALKFDNVTADWGLEQPSFSNGAVSADLDNDGDLDVVISNINDEAFLYENKQKENTEALHHYLKIKLEGNRENRGAFGSWVKVYYEGGKHQAYEMNPVRGYLSSISQTLFFGLGGAKQVDSIVVIWPDHSIRRWKGMNADQLVVLKQTGSAEKYSWETAGSSAGWFSEVSGSLGLSYEHRQKDFNDFAIQPLLPHKFSQYGPCMVNGDINGDGLEDLVIGGSNGSPLTMFFQQSDGKFKKREWSHGAPATDLAVFDMGLELFDADNDHDLDLYVAAGGYEERSGSPLYSSKLLVNDGKGEFHADFNALPQDFRSKSCVKSADYDKDGDADLFIGGRVEPWQYPKPVTSVLLRNDSRDGTIRFTDVTKVAAPGLIDIGLVCDGLWTDYNGDGWTDLVLAGEWMPLAFFKNQDGKLVNETPGSGIGDKTGWWNCLASADFDKDGDVDLIAGNVGGNSYYSNNSRYPVRNYYADFDRNGRYETITTRFLKGRNGEFIEYPVHSRDEVIDQLPSIKKRFLSYKSFAETPFKDLFKEELIKNSHISEANYFTSSLIRNDGNGSFEIIPLPQEVQLSSVFHFAVDDFNSDGNADVLVCGNDFSPEVFNGRLDAFNGLLLKGNGRGGFTSVPMQESGIYIPGDAKSLVKLKGRDGKSLVVAGQNRGTLKAFLSNRENGPVTKL